LKVTFLKETGLKDFRWSKVLKNSTSLREELKDEEKYDTFLGW